MYWLYTLVNCLFQRAVSKSLKNCFAKSICSWVGSSGSENIIGQPWSVHQQTISSCCCSISKSMSPASTLMSTRSDETFLCSQKLYTPSYLPFRYTSTGTIFGVQLKPSLREISIAVRLRTRDLSQ